jgi:MHS family shikimate/dehydroshikimate transporter-like MFS transporter
MSTVIAPSTEHNGSSNPGGTSTASIRRVVISSAIGTIAEYYDFFVYSTAAALVFGKLFFPSSDPTIGLMAAFGTYALGFLARPLGGIVFGHFGDVFGRKKALVITILICGLSTVSIGFLPTYASIGVAAPCLLIFIRIVQGVGVGGEQAGALLMTAEYAKPSERGFLTSFVQIGAPAGFLLPSALFAFLTSTLTEAQFLDWGWRVPFMLSLVLVAIGLYIRLQLSESPIFAEIRRKREVSSVPIREVFRDHARKVGVGILVKMIETVVFAMYPVLVLAYGKLHAIDPGVLLQSTIVAIVLELLFIPVVGKLTDRFGRRPVYMTGIVLQLVMAYPFFTAVDTGERLPIQIVMILVLSVGHALLFAPQGSMFPELFPARVRCSGIALIWQIGSLIGSGVLGLVAVKMMQVGHGSPIPLIAYVMSVAVVSAIALRWLPETAWNRRGHSDLYDWETTGR